MQKATRYEELLLKQNKAGIGCSQLNNALFGLNPILPCTKLCYRAGTACHTLIADSQIQRHCLPASGNGNDTSVTTLTKITHPVSYGDHHLCSFIVQAFSHSLTCSFTFNNGSSLLCIYIYICWYT